MLILPADAVHEDSPEQNEPDEEDHKNSTATEALALGGDDLQSEASPSGNDELTEDVALRTEIEEGSLGRIANGLRAGTRNSWKRLSEQLKMAPEPTTVW